MRLLRAVRFTARLGFELEGGTRSALESLADQILTVSPERITDELRKMLAAPSRAAAVRLLLHLKLLPHLLEPIRVDVTEAAPLATLRHLPATAPFPLALAALLLDVTAPAERRTWLPRHGPLHELAQRLRLSNHERDLLEWLLCQLHGFDESLNWPPSRLKPLLADPRAPLLLDLSEAAARGQGLPPHIAAHGRDRLAAWGPDVNPPPLVTGDDLKHLGLTPGPKFKELLDGVRAAQLDGQLTSHAEALAWLDERLR